MIWSNGTNTGNDLGDGWGIAIAVDPAANILRIKDFRGTGALDKEHLGHMFTYISYQ